LSTGSSSCARRSDMVVAPVIVGTPTVAGTSGGVTSRTLTVPTDVPGGLHTGDILVAVLRGQSAIADIDLSNAAFTRQGPAFSPNTDQGRILGLHTHVV